ncbi:BTAD domain-containing putative transcriptional regulator [Nocardia gipuzkoensis]|uniref:BTAD domain-containing putative transcriptional regulator n=1 Tax=Nocardia TaxID=1817 RepID=UPI00237D9C7E|nr:MULTISPECIES: BTAD domain-containing putative transcriptional regulator [Nocardia]MDE1672948.1 BTAD domain-containing putative transcriptional regulator [Nocardia gipuzkoensis]
MTLVRGGSGDHPPAIAVLGPLEVRGPDGARLTIPARKHADLLVILAAERTTRSAHYLCELLWRGHPPDSALVTLQGYVSRLRRALRPIPDFWIETGPNGYVLRCGGSGTDLDLLDVLSRDARAAHADGDVARTVELLERALRLWRGDALSDVDDVAELAPERARLDELRSELVELCAEGLIVLGRARHAVTILTDERERHPHREGTARLLALALRDSGRIAEALDVLVRLRRSLRADLGLDPAPDTVRIENEIRNPATPSTGRSALVGRADVAAVLDRARDRSQQGLTVVTVRGAPGIGKTAVVEDAVRRHGDVAFFTAGISGVRASALATLTSWLDQAALAGRVVPDLPTPRALAALFADVARETGRMVAIIDDVQWADPDSVRMIAAAVRVLRAHPVLLMLTVRPEPLPDEVGAAVRSLQSAGTHVAVELPPLSDEAVDELVRAGPGSVDPEVRAQIVELSGGSPFVAAQLCDLVRAGRPLDAGGAAAEITAAKLGAVSSSARALAEVLAVIGPHASIGLLAAADGAAGFDDRIGELVAARVVSVQDGVAAFGHELVRTAVLATIGGVRTALLHRRIADALAELRPGALTAQALHRSAAALAALDSAAAHACLAAARDALRRDAATECADLAARGIRHADPDDAELSIEFDLLAGQAHNRLGHYDAAAACFDRAGRRCGERRDWSGLARTALLAAPRGAAGYFSGYGVVQAGSSALRAQALAHRLDLDADLVADVEAIEAADRAIHGIAGDLDALAEARARSAPGSRSWPQVLLAEFVCTWEPATVADRRKIAEELEELAGHDRTARATAVHLRRVCALEAGDMRLVRRLSAEFARLASDAGTDLAATQLWWQVMLAVLRGDYQQSRALMTRFADDLGAVDDRARLLAEASVLTSSSIELWHRGRLGEVLGEADRMAEDFDEDFALVVAMAAAEIDDHDRAMSSIESIIALPGSLHGPRVVVRVPLLIEALLVVGRRAPRYRDRVVEFTAELEPLTREWGETLIVQWPGLVCLGPSGLYRGTARGILGLPGARDEVVAARNRARALGARPYESRAEARLSLWPFA